MSVVRCAHCGEDTFTIDGWADLDHCASCGRPLAAASADTRAALAAWRRVHAGRGLPDDSAERRRFRPRDQLPQDGD